MATDLFGNPLHKGPEYRLSLWQKRQAAMLYRWMSLDYLKGLKDLIDALIKGADVTLELAKRQGRDALIANPRWGVRDTAANWSTYAFPALEDFRRSTMRLIAWRTTESYCGTGAGHCDRMLSEFSSLWMTEEEEERFNEQWNAVANYASKIDDVAGAGGQKQLDDFSMVMAWIRDEAAFFPRLPRFRVRTDVEAASGKRPPRTGVYVPHDDPNGTLQFGWTGNDDGKLGPVMTFSAFGSRVLAEIGRDVLWIDEPRMAALAIRAMKNREATDFGPYDLDDVERYPDMGPSALAFSSFEARPCKWYFVEEIEGEFDDEPDLTDDGVPPSARLRCEGGEACPREGWWFSPAAPASRRRFKAGEVMPEFRSDYGTTIWQWDPDQSPQ